jgi:multidrug efflux system membrane fusion protein
MNSSTHSPKIYRTRRFWLGLVILTFLILTIHHFITNSKNHSKNKGQTVVLGKVTTANVPVYLSALGTVTPAITINIKTEVTGELIKIFFKEGDKVKAGEVLAEIDPRPFEAQVLEFEGQLARDQALLANAQTDLKRYQKLYKLKSVSQQILDTQKSLVKQLKGTVELDQGQLDNARVNLSYCKITSPIDGRIGIQLVNLGNIVQVSDATGIAVVNSLNPISVEFSLPEDNVPEVAEKVYAGVKLSVKAYDRMQSKLLGTGCVSSLDNQIDPTTGTVKLKANFLNKKNALFPNQFVNVKVLINTLANAAIVPTAAIQQGVKGPFVYLVNPNNTVSVKPVSPGVTEGDYTTVTHSLTPGQSVVLEGADKLSDGSAITVNKGQSPA